MVTRQGIMITYQWTYLPAVSTVTPASAVCNFWNGNNFDVSLDLQWPYPGNGPSKIFNHIIASQRTPPLSRQFADSVADHSSDVRVQLCALLQDFAL
jgi:hypothetical protein